MAYAAPDTTSANYQTAVNSSACVGAWDLSWWQHDTTADHHVLYSTGNGLVVTSFGTSVMFASNDGTQNFRATASSTTSWTHMLLHKKSDGGCVAYQDGVVLSTDSTAVLSSSAGLPASTTVYLGRGGAKVSDVMMISGTVDSTVWDYYRQDVIAGGDRCLPNG
jgi:hypothetical protein